MRPKIRSLPGLADYADVGPPSVDRVKGIKRVALVIDARNHSLSIPHPVRGRIAEVRDVFMRALRVRFQNAGY